MKDKIFPTVHSERFAHGQNVSYWTIGSAWLFSPEISVRIKEKCIKSNKMFPEDIGNPENRKQKWRRKREGYRPGRGGGEGVEGGG